VLGFVEHRHHDRERRHARQRSRSGARLRRLKRSRATRAYDAAMRRSMQIATFIALGLALAAGAVIHARFRADLERAREHAAQGSRLVATRCGAIEVQEAGQGAPVLMVHGSGGGHDQGMDWARPLAAQGLRVIAMSRFGYLRTPRPDDASPQAQADAHACLLDALGLERAAVIGVSAGAASALELALRHPQRVAALVLVVPIVHKPGAVPDSAPPVSDDEDAWLLRLLGSDALYWSALQVARDAVLRHVLATPPELVAAASEAERARVHAMAERVLPVSLRAAGLADDTRLGKRLGPAALESIRVPTLVVSARDDGFGTYAGAEYTASRIAGARFLGFERGGHLLVGHDEATRAAIVELLRRAGP
jgi:pimeloyl-ACP methyl ester carboxylesterase